MLSVRMQAVYDLVSPDMTPADIGTDHGFVPIALVRNGKCGHAIAADVRPGPLSHAKDNIAAYGLEDRIETRLSDGLKNFRPGEADSVIIAGMGGMLMIRILDEGALMLQSVRELILQPQSDIDRVRMWLHDHGYMITGEKMVIDMGKYYTAMRSVKGQDTPYDAADYVYGRCLLETGSEVLAEYLRQQNRQLMKIRETLMDQKDSEKSRNRICDIDRMLALGHTARERNEKALSVKGGESDESL